MEVLLETPRLRLEPLEVRHADLLFPKLQDARQYEFIGEIPPASCEALRERYARLASGWSPDRTERWLNWAVFSSEEEGYVGYVQATIHRDGTAHIAYLVFADAWGKGYGREASALMIEQLVSHHCVENLYASVDVQNQRSIHLLEELGFERIRVRENAEQIRGEWRSEAEYHRRALSSEP